MLEIVGEIFFKFMFIINGIIAVPIMVVFKPLADLLRFDEFVPYIYNFFDMAFTYVGFFVYALHIPLAPFLVLVGLCGYFITFNIAVRSVMVIRNTYLFFKGR